MYAEILILDHQPTGLRERRGRVNSLIQIVRRSRKPGPQIRFFITVARDRKTQQRAYVDAGVALDAQLFDEYRLDIAVETTLNLARGLFGVEPKFHFDVD